MSGTVLTAAYTETSNPLGQGVATPAEIMAFFDARGPALALQFAPDRTYKPVERDLAEIIIEESARYAGDGAIANHDMIAGDIYHESAAGQSYLYRDKHNPSGLGATNDDPNGKGITCADIREGVRRTVAHWLNYFVGRGPWTNEDPRYAAMIAEQDRRRLRPDEYPGDAWKMVGIPPELRQLGGRWAVPGVGYGAAIARAANAIATYLDGAPLIIGQDPRFLWTPDTLEFGYPQGVRGRAGVMTIYGIIHITEGSDSQGWLVGGNGSSTHYLTWRDMTPRSQHVSESDAAWTAGNREYNLRGKNVEAERRAGDPWTDAQYKAFAATTYPIWQRDRIPLRRTERSRGLAEPGLLGHADVPDPEDPRGWGGSTNHTDPGPRFNWDQYLYELRRLDSIIPTPPARPAVLQWSEVPYVVGGGFKMLYESIDEARNPGAPDTGLAGPMVGYPRSNEFVAWLPSAKQEKTVQVFDRGAFVYSAGEAAPWDITKALGMDEVYAIGQGYKAGKITRTDAVLLLSAPTVALIDAGTLTFDRS
jgi:hypothetical protein